MFRHSAFLAPSLTHPEGIEQLRIHPGENELPLPLRPELKEVFIFRKAVRTTTGYQISPIERNERITYSMMRGWIVAIGVIMGIAYTVIMYSLRYLTGNMLDKSRMFPPPLRRSLLTIPVQRISASRFGTCPWGTQTRCLSRDIISHERSVLTRTLSFWARPLSRPSSHSLVALRIRKASGGLPS